MTVSSLARASIITTKRNTRTQKVGKFTPHYMCAYWTGEQCASYFQSTDRQCSANYCIGYDGGIVCNVPEEYRAWTSSSSWNDQRAITVECANLAGGQLTDATWKSLVKLGADICRRYGFRPYYDGTKNGTLTEHRMFASTDCPGPWLHARMGDLAVAIKNELDGTKPKPAPTVVPKKGPDEEVGMAAVQGPVYRLYNPWNGDHLITTSDSEVKNCVKAGWVNEDTIGTAPKGLVQVYRLYNADTYEHLMTDNISEVNSLLKLGKNYSNGEKHGWQFEGCAFIARDDKNGPHKIHRLFNPYAKGPAHLLSDSESEIENLTKLGWKDEGVFFSLD